MPSAFRPNSYIHGDRSHFQVVGRVVVADRIAGPPVYVKRGAYLPPDVLMSQVEHLIAVGLVKDMRGEGDAV